MTSTAFLATAPFYNLSSSCTPQTWRMQPWTRRWQRIAVIVSSLLLLLAYTPSPARSQDNGQAAQTSRSGIELTFSGLFQPRLSAGWTGGENSEQRVGFGIRRARLAAETSIRDRAGVFLQTEFASGSIVGIDAYAFYDLDQIRLRLGRFAGAQPRAFNLTSSTRIDAVDRAAIAERWGQQTIGSDGRDFGLEARYESDETSLAVFLHNGDGNWSRVRGNYRESLSSPSVTGGVFDTGIALSFYGNHHLDSVDGLEIGGFVGYNSSRNPNTEAFGQGRTYGSLAGHAYWGADPGSQPWRLKADVIAMRYEGITIPVERLERSLAIALLAAHGPRDDIELFARYEYDYRVDAGPNPDQFFVTGAHWSPSATRGGPFHHERLTFAYGLIPSFGGQNAQHLMVLQAQIVF